MKKIFLSSILVVILFGNLFAQTDPARDEQNLIFQYIDKAQIPSGYLDEYGPQVVDKNWLNGVLTDSNRSIHNIYMFFTIISSILNNKAVSLIFLTSMSLQFFCCKINYSYFSSHL